MSRVAWMRPRVKMHPLKSLIEASAKTTRLVQVRDFSQAFASCNHSKSNGVPFVKKDLVKQLVGERLFIYGTTNGSWTVPLFYM